MDRRMSALLVLLLPQLILGYFQDGECDCGTQFFPPETQSISLDSVWLNQSCTISCSYEIAPHPRIPIVFFRELGVTENICFQMHLYYMKYTGTVKERIYFTDLTRDKQKVYPVPVGIGLIFELRLENCSEVSASLTIWRQFDERVEQNPCPNPFLEVTSEAQTILTEGWGSTGCTFRLTTTTRTDLRVDCEPGSALELLGAEPGEKIESWSVPSIREHYEHLYSRTIDITAIGREPRKTGRTFCNITYVMSKEELCICRSNLTLREDTEVSLTSPGFPRMLCEKTSCLYNFVREDIPAGHANAFVLTVQHFRRHRDDLLVVYPPNEEKIIGALYDKFLGVGTQTDQVERYVVQARELSLAYTASISKNSREIQGFNLTMTTINVPEECLCPNFPSIRRESGVIRTSVAASCPEMQCRYNVLYPEEMAPSQGGFTPPKYLKVDVEAEFEQRESLKITVDDKYFGYETGNSSLARLTASNVTIVYRRGTARTPRTNESFYEISYKWVYNRDCSCEREDVEALSGEWREIYSPRFPEGNSCHLECRNSFSVPDGHHLLVNVTFLGVKNNCFLLSLYEGYNETSKRVRTLEGGSSSMEMIRLPGQNVTIEQTYQPICDRNSRQGGYVIAYTAEKDVEGRGFFKDALDFFTGLFYKEPKKQGSLFSIFKGSN